MHRGMGEGWGLDLIHKLLCAPMAWQDGLRLLWYSSYTSHWQWGLVATPRSWALGPQCWLGLYAGSGHITGLSLPTSSGPECLVWVTSCG